MDNIIQEFLAETHESLYQLEHDLLSLEKDTTSQEFLASIFRTAHNIKGSSGILGFPKLASIAHAGESLLSLVRDRKLALTEYITQGLLMMIDTMRGITTSIEKIGSEDQKDYSPIIMLLEKLQSGEPDPEVVKVLKAKAPLSGDTGKTNLPEATQSPVSTKSSLEETSQTQKLPTAGETLQPDPLRPIEISDATDPLKTQALVLVPATEALKTQELLQPNAAAKTQALVPATEALKTQEFLQPNAAAKTQEPINITETFKIPLPALMDTVQATSCGPTLPIFQAETRKLPLEDFKHKDGTSANLSENNIRVHVALLDSLMNMVGELVLVRNQILQCASVSHSSVLVNVSQRLNLITSELQEGIMKTRMQPIENVWGKFTRMVRDLAMMTGKKVNLEMKGNDTELDRTILEAIKDPLVHLVRNSIDHGIEVPEGRKAKGKPETGHIVLSAFHEGGHVNIEVADDGGGIDPELVRRKAIQKSWLSHEQAARMNDWELLNMIFLPGFSCADKITSISGRGVGLDVVKTNIEKIGGTIDLQNRLGHGCTFKLKIPLTLAIIPALIVTCGGARYAIPQVGLVELVRLEGKEGKQKIEMIHNAPVYRLRGNLLPVVYLHQELQIETKAASDIVNIVVLQSDKRQFGLVVDQINDTQEIVVKPLGKQLKGISVFAGATIMGDGKVSLILDVMGIAQKAKVISQVHDRTIADSIEAVKKTCGETHTLLLFKIGGNRRMAIPLSLVTRLEVFPRDAVQKAAGYDVVCHRDRIMPVIYLADILNQGLSTPAHQDKMYVVVYNDGNRQVGLVVDHIIDIVQECLRLQKCTNRIGVMGSAVIQGSVTDILDLQTIIDTANPPCFEQTFETDVRI
jgi:two-component system chemotaxis sensor kinase CheA